MADAIGMRTERNVAGGPDPTSAFYHRVRLPRIGNHLNFVTLSQALDHLLPDSGRVSVAPQSIDI